MIWVLLIVLAIVWTILMVVAGYYSGWESHKKEVASKEIFQLPLTYNSFTQSTPELTSEQMDDIANLVVEFMGDKARGTDGKQGPPGPSFLDQDLVAYHMSGEEWIEHVMQRLSRVERRAGMSV